MARLKNKNLSVEISADGAELQSIQKDGIEYLWQGDPEFWGRRAPVLFPIVGKLKNGRYQLAGKTYKMGGHGFARDSRFEEVSVSADKAVYQLTESADTLSAYPYAFRLTVSYALVADTITVSYTVENTDTQPIQFGIGAHPAFNVPLEHGTFENYTLTLSPKAKRAFIPLNPETGLTKTHEQVFVMDHKKPLTRELFKNDALVYASSFQMSVSLTNNLDARGVTVSWEDMPYFGLWSPYPKEAPFVCIEPWCGLADAEYTSGELTEKFAINTLEAGKTFACSYKTAIS
ncbi:MAG: aldose 1-epimerase family protein [Streptococcaceae bacterium]|jgi:galactose mutarotase-like enzyme|nr:aldose 1-epimerase family protein [Streptococcaceae bacterium]